MSSVQRAALAWNILERSGVPGVTDVHCPAANNGTTLMIQLRQTYRGQAKQAAAAIWGSNAAHLRYKHIWVVDEDIDIHDYGAIDWAFAYRCNAAEDDIVFYPGTFGSALDPSTRLKYRNTALYGTGKWCRVLIDCHGQPRLRARGELRRRPLSALGQAGKAGLGPGRQALEGIRLQEVIRRLRGAVRQGAAAASRSPTGPRWRVRRRCVRRQSAASGAISASGASTKARSNSARMRQRQFRRVDPHLIIGDQIDVERARAPAMLAGAVAAEGALDHHGARASSPSGGSSVAATMAQLMNGGWSVTPQGGVR